MHQLRQRLDHDVGSRRAEACDGEPRAGGIHDRPVVGALVEHVGEHVHLVTQIHHQGPFYGLHREPAFPILEHLQARDVAALQQHGDDTEVGVWLQTWAPTMSGRMNHSPAVGVSPMISMEMAKCVHAYDLS